MEARPGPAAAPQRPPAARVAREVQRCVTASLPATAAQTAEHSEHSTYTYSGRSTDARVTDTTKKTEYAVERHSAAPTQPVPMLPAADDAVDDADGALERMLGA